MAKMKYGRRLDNIAEDIAGVKKGGVKDSERDRLKKLKSRRRAVKADREIYRDAKDIARASYLPVLNELEREEKDAEEDYNDTSAELSRIYSELGEALAPLYGNYETEAAEIASNYDSALEGLNFAPSTGAGIESPVGTQATTAGSAAANLLATIGAGGAERLASDASRNLSYTTSAQRQGALSEKDAKLKAYDSYQELVESITGQRKDVKAEKGAQIASLMPQLEQQAFDNKMRKKDQRLASDIAKDQHKWAKNDRKDANKDEKNAEKFFRDETERKYDKKHIKPIKKDIKGLQKEIASLKDQIEALGSSGGPEASIAAQQAEDLRKKKRRLKKKVDKKTRRIESIKETDNV